jgi:hypothetical protein
LTFEGSGLRTQWTVCKGQYRVQGSGFRIQGAGC